MHAKDSVYLDQCMCCLFLHESSNHFECLTVLFSHYCFNKTMPLWFSDKFLLPIIPDIMSPSVHVLVITPLLKVPHSAFITLWSPLILQIIGVKRLSDTTAWLCISPGSPCTPARASSCKPSAWPACSPSCVTVFGQSAVQCSAQSRHPYFVQVLFSTNRYAHSAHHTHLSILSSQQTPYSAVHKIICGLPSDGVKVFKHSKPCHWFDQKEGNLFQICSLYCTAQVVQKL